MPDPNAQRLDDAHRRRLARLKEQTALQTSAVQSDLHKNGISARGFVDWIVANIIGGQRTKWIGAINSVPLGYVDVEINKTTIERRPFTCHYGMNNYAVTRMLMNVYTAQPFFVLENITRVVLGQPLRKWGE